jgi:hypothetical protein
MGKARYFFNGTTTPQTFTPISGVTTYNFVVIGGAGGGEGGLDNIAGGFGGVVKATYYNVTEVMQLVIGGGGGGAGSTAEDVFYASGGGGLTQVFSKQVNIIAGGGGGSYGAQPGGEACAGNGPAGQNVYIGDNSYAEGGRADGIGGRIVSSGTYIESGGSFNSTGNGGNGVNIQGRVGGGGGAGINGIAGQGGTESDTINNGGINGGGSGYGGGGGGGAGYGGGGAGYGGGGAGYGGGAAGSSTVLLAGVNVSYAPAPYADLPYGVGVKGERGGNGYVEITWTTPTPPISNICFPAGTPIQTDQGIIPIEHLQPGVHTLQHQPIQHITQTRTLDKYLIAFAPHVLGKNVPRQRTIMSKDHKLLYNNQMVPAERFLDVSVGVTKVAYHGETLYNVLLHKYQLMNVNGLSCETLHPENAIARLYKQQLKGNVNSKGRYAYKSLTRRLNTLM